MKVYLPFTPVVQNQINKYKKWAVIIGPEGGFSEKEKNVISSVSSCISVSLGRRILRSDTATTAAIFSIQSLIEENIMSDNLS